MVATAAFFPVDNGDMTLVELESGRKIQIDINIGAAADDPDDDTLDVAAALWDPLKRDRQGRPCVGAPLINHATATTTLLAREAVDAAP